MKWFPIPVLALCLTAMPTQAQDLEKRADDIVDVLQGEAPYNEVFDDVFIASVPQQQFDELSAQWIDEYGAVVGLESVEETSPTTGRIAIRFERGIATGVFALSAAEPHRVAGFLVHNVGPADDSPDNLLADVQALPGETSILITPLASGEPVLAHNSDQPMAIGSTFKLYILSTLARQVAAGERSWADTVMLDNEGQLSGVTSTWPQGAPITLHTLATQMISISDNTATDQLLSILGRNAVESEVAASGHSDPSLLVPFMATREMFALKISGDVEAYRTMDAAERLAVLEATADTEIEGFDFMMAFTGGPNAIDIEWFASAEDLANLLRRLQELDDPAARAIMGVNRAVADDLIGDYHYVGYKGGSEPGVLNLTWLLQDRAADWHVVSLGWNNPDAEVDHDAFRAIAMRAIALAVSD